MHKYKDANDYTHHVAFRWLNKSELLPIFVLDIATNMECLQSLWIQKFYLSCCIAIISWYESTFDKFDKIQFRWFKNIILIV